MPNLVSSAISPNLDGFSKTFFSLKGMISLHPQKIFLTPLPPLGGSKNGAESLGGVHLVLQQQLAKNKNQVLVEVAQKFQKEGVGPTWGGACGPTHGPTHPPTHGPAHSPLVTKQRNQVLFYTPYPMPLPMTAFLRLLDHLTEILTPCPLWGHLPVGYLVSLHPLNSGQNLRPLLVSCAITYPMSPPTHYPQRVIPATSCLSSMSTQKMNLCMPPLTH